MTEEILRLPLWILLVSLWGIRKQKSLGLIKLFSLVSYGLFAGALKIKLKEHCCCNCMSNDYSII